MADAERNEEFFWAELVARLLHPIQVEIIESMWWIDRPLSASELVEVLDRRAPLGTVAYHARRLAGLNALERAGRRQVRGAEEKFYRLVMKRRSGG